MSDRSKQKEPADQPASIPSASQIEADRKREVGAQVRAAVENVLTKGGSVSAARFRKWEADGTGYFFRVLRKRLTEEMSEISPAGIQVALPKSVKARGSDAKTERTTQRADAGKAAPAALPVSTDRDWVDQQRNRWSTRARAIMHGLIVAVTLFVGAALFTRLWGTLVPFILQQIQNWR